MLPGFLVRFRPLGPWRIGPDSGARDQVDRIYHSDTLFSAVTCAMRQLGMLEEWLAATARDPGRPAVRLSSCFPFYRDALYVEPPRSLWPPPPSVKVRWKGARFVPLAVVEALVAGRPIEEDRWAVDAESECLVPSSDAGHPAGPFRVAMRSSAAVDRLTGASVAAHSAACLEFRDGAGFWAAVAFGDADAEAKWAEPVKAALRLLADSGMGGERSRGWGHSRMPLFSGGTFPELLVRPEPQTPIPVEGEPAPPIETAYWLLSLFSPAAEDLIDWDSGNYVFLARGGRVDSPAGIGAQKKVLRMVAEGSVLFSAAAPRGTARDVAPDGFPHPVYRSGLAFCIPIPVKPPTPQKVTP